MFVENKVFKEINYTINKLKRGDYEECSFINCNFSETDLSTIKFTDCDFNNCDFSNTKMFDTALKTVVFNNCKLLGVAFNDCNPFLFSITLNNCILNLASFYKTKLVNTKFSNCNMQEVDFSESNLTNALFENCNLKHAIFDNSNLEKANLASAINYSIDPSINNIKKAKFGLKGISGLLDKHNIEIENY